VWGVIGWNAGGDS